MQISYKFTNLTSLALVVDFVFYLYDKGKTFQVIVFLNIGNRSEIISLIPRNEERNFVAHGKSVRWVDCHPLNENYLVSASQDG